MYKAILIIAYFYIITIESQNLRIKVCVQGSTSGIKD